MPPQEKIKVHVRQGLGQHGEKNTTYRRSKQNRVGREKAITEVQVEGKLVGKRKVVAHPELPSKHRRLFEDEVVSYFSMVETGAHLHQ